MGKPSLTDILRQVPEGEARNRLVSNFIDGTTDESSDGGGGDKASAVHESTSSTMRGECGSHAITSWFRFMFHISCIYVWFDPLLHLSMTLHLGRAKTAMAQVRDHHSPPEALTELMIEHRGHNNDANDGDDNGHGDRDMSQTANTEGLTSPQCDDGFSVGRSRDERIFHQVTAHSRGAQQSSRFHRAF